MKCLFVILPCECIGGKNAIQTFKAIGIYSLAKNLMDGIDVQEDNLVFEVTCPKCRKTRRLRTPIADIDKVLDLFVPYCEDFIHQDYVL